MVTPRLVPQYAYTYIYFLAQEEIVRTKFICTLDHISQWVLFSRLCFSLPERVRLVAHVEFDEKSTNFTKVAKTLAPVILNHQTAIILK